MKTLDLEFLKQYDEFEDCDILSELVSRFKRTVPIRTAAIRLAIENKDAKALEFEAHAFKSQCGNVGAVASAEICLALEDLGEEKVFEGSMDFYSKLVKSLPQVLTDLDVYLGSKATPSSQKHVEKTQ